MPIPGHFFILALLLAPALGARADCIADAAARHGVNGDVLRAIGWQESRLQAAALGHNANGTIDIGAFQVNSIHLRELARYGIDRAALHDGCVSAEVAAWHYRRQVDRLGDTWSAVGAYHSVTPFRAAGYANRIAAILMAWGVMSPGPLPFAANDARAPDPPRAPTPPPQSVEASLPAATDQALAFLPPARRRRAPSATPP
jgi:lysozyme-related protein Hpa2